MDKVGNIRSGTVTSSSSQYPGIAYTAARADSLGTLQGENPSLARRIADQQPASLGRLLRHDRRPVDDCTFWYTTEY